VHESRYAATKTQLARRCGITYYRLLSNWDRSGRPKDHSPGKNRYDVEKYRNWINGWKSAHNFGNGHNSEFAYKLNPREQAYADRATAAAAREKFRLEVEMAEYVPRLSANNQIEAANTVVRRELRKALEFELPPRLVGMTAAQMRVVMIDKLKEILSHLPHKIMGSNGYSS